MVDFRSVRGEVGKLRISGLEAHGEFWRDAHILARDMDRLSLAIKTFTIPLRDSVENVIIPSIRKNYDVEGRPKWKKLSDITISQRGNAGPILDRTGKMKRVTTSLGVWVISNIKAEMVGVDRRNKYAKYHQAGTNKMAQRVIALIQEEDQKKIEEIFMKWVIFNSIMVGRFKPDASTN